MNILLTGASGVIGSALEPFLANQSHRVIELVRISGEGKPAPAQAWWNPNAGQIGLENAPRLDAVIHLAGENIAQRWTPAAKVRIYKSRVEGTKLLTKALASLPRPPEVFLSASAIGYYGDRGDELLDERSAAGTGFLADLCRDWEAATGAVVEHAIRVVNLRIGIVLATQGALGKMLPAFRFGLGGKLGNGRQFWSWIELDDLLGAINLLLSDQTLKGPINLVSPHPVTNAEFTQTLGSVLRRPTIFSMPALAVKLAFGEMADAALLASARVRPARLEERGFVFRYPELQGALRHVVGSSSPGLSCRTGCNRSDDRFNGH